MNHLNPSALFRLTDDGSGGALQTFKRRLKQGIRSWLGQRSLRRVAQSLDHPVLRGLPTLEPQLLLRPLRSYLWNGLNPSKRAQAFDAHFTWLRETFEAADIDTLYRWGRMDICSLPAEPGTLNIALACGRGLGREGELELHLSLDGCLLLRAAFCILPTHLLGADAPALGSRIMVIGSVQGSLGKADGMKALTGATHRSRPKALLLDALQGLREGWGIDALVGVSTRSHVYGRYRSLSRRVGLDYDLMWQELGSLRRVGHHWVLPNAPVMRSPQEVPSRKRAEHRRRSEFRQALNSLARDWSSAIFAKAEDRRAQVRS